jgi:hypothetical protein
MENTLYIVCQDGQLCCPMISLDKSAVLKMIYRRDKQQTINTVYPKKIMEIVINWMSDSVTFPMMLNKFEIIMLREALDYYHVSIPNMCLHVIDKKPLLFYWFKPFSDWNIENLLNTLNERETDDVDMILDISNNLDSNNHNYPYYAGILVSEYRKFDLPFNAKFAGVRLDYADAIDLYRLTDAPEITINKLLCTSNIKTFVGSSSPDLLYLEFLYRNCEAFHQLINTLAPDELCKNTWTRNRIILESVAVANADLYCKIYQNLFDIFYTKKPKYFADWKLSKKRISS